MKDSSIQIGMRVQFMFYNEMQRGRVMKEEVYVNGSIKNTYYHIRNKEGKIFKLFAAGFEPDIIPAHVYELTLI